MTFQDRTPREQADYDEGVQQMLRSASPLVREMGRRLCMHDYRPNARGWPVCVGCGRTQTVLPPPIRDYNEWVADGCPGTICPRVER